MRDMSRVADSPAVAQLALCVERSILGPRGLRRLSRDVSCRDASMLSPDVTVFETDADARFRSQ
jgi:hypothetical protein